MSLRTRLLLAFAAVVLVPLALLSFGFRQQTTRRLSEDYDQRLERVARDIEADLARQSADVQSRLASLRVALVGDNRFRLGAVAGVESDSAYVLDYAGSAMRLAGLSMLQIHDGVGRIVSSGHFRNEHGRVDVTLVPLLERSKGVATFVTARTPDREFLALARSERLVISGRSFVLVGGVAVDGTFLRRLAADPAMTVSLRYPGGGLSSDPPATSDTRPPETGGSPGDGAHELRVSVITPPGGGFSERVPATLVVRQSRAPLAALLRDANALILATAAGAGAAALLLAVWVSSRISRPIAVLAEKTAVLDLDRLDIQFDEGTDEVGLLSRVLGDLADRLRTSTARVREAERRATIGDLARQINHDIKNGLIPLRNVMRHLAQVGRDDPGALASVLAERRQTLDSSIAYLETLATNYERLSLPRDRRECDLNALVTELAGGAGGAAHVDLRADLAPGLPRVAGDPVALRRILENLIANAVDSLESKPGRVTVSTARAGAPGEPPVVRVTVADTGRGMSRDESARIFTDFYTTKPGGTGLGLSIVRRLVMDLQGTVRVESEPGKGTRMIVELPAGARAAEGGVRHPR